LALTTSGAFAGTEAPHPATGSTETDALTLRVDAPRLAIRRIPFRGLRLSLHDREGNVATQVGGRVELRGIEWITSAGLPAAPPDPLTVVDGRLAVDAAWCRVGDAEISLRLADGTQLATPVRLIPGWLSLLPPFVAIAAGLLLRQMVVALGLGVLVGMTIVHDYQPHIGFLRYLDDKLIRVFSDPDNAQIILFSLLLGGMVGIISRTGGTQGIVEVVARRARSARSGQLATWAMGLFIFFDDYANTLIVGNTMRPITDRLRISREKLAYIVDSTAAPVAGLFLITTWIGYEAGLVGAAVRDVEWAGDGYQTLIRSIPYRFYSIFTLALVFLLAASRRDFGPMRRAERRAANEGKLLADGASPLSDAGLTNMSAPEDVPKRWVNAVVPIVAVVAVTVVGIYHTGRLALGDNATEATFAEVFGAGSSYSVLMWASATGCLLAGLLAWVQRLASMQTIVEAWLTGIRSLVLAIVVLVLAWSISSLCRDDLHTGAYVASVTRGTIPPWAIPSITFLIAGVIAYATGTSFGTMGILIPLAIPYAVHASGASPTIVLPTIGAVLAGATFGDHCSPISDTTIMSSMASGCDHIDHVRTQTPYAATTAAVAIAAGYLPAGLGVSPWLLLPAGAIILWAVVYFFGIRPGGSGHNGSTQAQK